jgi:hypothetical protein
MPGGHVQVSNGGANVAGAGQVTAPPAPAIPEATEPSAPAVPAAELGAEPARHAAVRLATSIKTRVVGLAIERTDCTAPPLRL